MGLLDTSQNGLVDALSSFGRERFTGCVYVVDKANSQTGRIYFRDGSVYAAQVDGFLPRIARRLRTAGVLTHDTYSEVVNAHGGDDTDPGLGATCLENGLTDQATLDALNREFVLSAIGAILGWPEAKVKTTNTDGTDLFVIKPVTVEKALNAIAKRQEYGGNLWQEIGGGSVIGGVVPSRTPKPHVPGDEPTPDLDAFYAFIDGHHSLDQIAGELGLTRFEAVHMLHSLINEGAVSVPKGSAPLSRSVADPQTASVPAHEVGTHTLLIIPDTGYGLDSLAPRIESDSALTVPDFWSFRDESDADTSSVFGATATPVEAVVAEEPQFDPASGAIRVPGAVEIIVDDTPAAAAAADEEDSGPAEWEDVAVADEQAIEQNEEAASEWVSAVEAVSEGEAVAERHQDGDALNIDSVEWQDAAGPAAADSVAAEEWVEAVEEAAVQDDVPVSGDVYQQNDWTQAGDYSASIPVPDYANEVVSAVENSNPVEDENTPSATDEWVAEEAADVVADDSATGVEVEAPVASLEDDDFDYESLTALAEETSAEPVSDEVLSEEPVTEAVADEYASAEPVVVETATEYVVPTIDAPETLAVAEVLESLETDDDVVEFAPLHANAVPDVVEVQADENTGLLAAAPAPDPTALINMPAPADPYAEQRAREAAEREERRRLLTQSLEAIEETLRRQEERARVLRGEVEQSLAMKTTLNNVLSDAQMLHSQTKHAYDQAQEVFRQAEEVYTQVERDLGAADTRRTTAVARLSNAQEAVTVTNTAREQAEAAVRAAHEEFLRRVNAYNQTVQEYEAASREVNEADSFYRQVEQALEQVKPQRDMYYQQYGAALRGTETATARLQSAEQDYSRAQTTYEEVRREFREVEDEVRGLRSELQDVRNLLADLDD